MPKQKGHIGGFAAVNHGNIENCNSVVKLDIQKRLTGGFVAENAGTIENSYSFGRIDKLTGGFVGLDQGSTCKANYFLYKEKEGSKKIKRLSDADKGQRLDELKNNDTISAIGFDTEKIWEYRGNEIPIGFIEENWSYEIPGQDREPLLISSVDELKEWATKVNDGDKEAAAAYIRLENDLDLGGKEWIPIGESRVNPFTGIFDGNGHQVRNFHLKDKKRENKGFFGFLKGDVYNLSVDCIISQGSCVGGLAAQNDGTIGCCSAVVSIKGNDGVIGGLAGKNTGRIFHSYTAGRIHMLVIPIWWGIPLLGILVLLLVFLKDPDGFLPTFAPVPYDDDAIPIPDDVNTPNTDGNFVSFQFKQQIDVDLATGFCQFEFKNPGNSNHNIVVQLQFTDAQAIRVMGGTGRSAQEQARLEAMPGYDPENNRTVIAESGAIAPGYQLDNLRLVDLEGGAVLPAGTYNAMVYLVFYDIGTNNRAMLESQLPVEITVH